jgi:HAD superfamily phosphatase (TIGR01681 family)
LDFRPGYNLVRIPWSQFCFDPSLGQVCLAVFPAEDCAPRMIFTWLDLVRLRAHPGAGSGGEPPPEPPAAKVKCVAWDLDNTLWSGILVEDGPERIRLRPEVLAVIQELDQRGIIHTIVSKNTHEQAWAVLQALGLADYFVFPAINWGSKSANLRQVAKRINIGLDSFAFVDDTPFEFACIPIGKPRHSRGCQNSVSPLPR